MGVGGGGTQAAAFEDGNWFDRIVYITLIVLALRALMSRNIEWSGVIRKNLPLAMLLLFGLVSVTWSDFPAVAIKRWIRDIGGYLVLLVVLSEDDPRYATEVLLRRLAYILMPVSVVLVKYYPDLGRGYDGWTGAAFYMGVTTNKNMLGLLCFMCGIFLLWDCLVRWHDRKNPATRRVLYADAFILGLTLWLMNLANSSTSTVCFVIGAAIVSAKYIPGIRHNIRSMGVIIPVTFAAYFSLDWLINLREIVTSSVGRDSTFTGRVDLWEYLDTIDTNWLLGSGYESFWLGPRLDLLWARFQWGPTQAHNGYREMYLNLGMAGLLLLFGVLIAGYVRMYRQLATSPDVALLGLSIFVTLLLYNWTETAFRNGHLLLSTFLLLTAVAPRNHALRKGVPSMAGGGWLAQPSLKRGE
jgi:hypothetical protein